MLEVEIICLKDTGAHTHSNTPFFLHLHPQQHMQYHLHFTGNSKLCMLKLFKQFLLWPQKENKLKHYSWSTHRTGCNYWLTDNRKGCRWSFISLAIQELPTSWQWLLHVGFKSKDNRWNNRSSTNQNILKVSVLSYKKLWAAAMNSITGMMRVKNISVLWIFDYGVYLTQEMLRQRAIKA